MCFIEFPNLTAVVAMNRKYHDCNVANLGVALNTVPRVFTFRIRGHAVIVLHYKTTAHNSLS